MWKVEIIRLVDPAVSSQIDNDCLVIYDRPFATCDKCLGLVSVVILERLGSAMRAMGKTSELGIPTRRRLGVVMVENGLMIRRATFRVNRRRGAVAVVVTICLIPLIGVMAFAIDGGFMLAARRRAQTVADAASYAAACQLYNNLSSDPTGLDVSGKAHTAAFSNASANGFTNDGSTNTVKINIPPSNSSRLWQTKPGYAEVVVTYNQPRIFGAVLGSGTMSITARSVARGVVIQASSDSIVALDPSAGGALSATGGGSITTSGGIQVNSSNSGAALASGNGSITAPTISITGNYNQSGNGSVKATSGPVMTAAQPLANPLGSISPPDPSSLSAQSAGKNSTVLLPGIYDGGISLSGKSAVYLQSGIYYLKNGDFSLAGQASVGVIPDPITGATGVMIYMNDGSLKFAGGSSLNMTPMTTGPYAGLVYYQNPSDSNAVNLTGGSNVSITGTVCAPSADVSLTGGSSFDQLGSQIISRTVSIAGHGNINMNTTSANTALTRSLTLVE